MSVSAFSDIFSSVSSGTQVPPLPLLDSPSSESSALYAASVDKQYAESFWSAEDSLSIHERRRISDAVSHINGCYFTGGLIGGLLLNAKGLYLKLIYETRNQERTKMMFDLTSMAQDLKGDFSDTRSLESLCDQF